MIPATENFIFEIRNSRVVKNIFPIGLKFQASSQTNQNFFHKKQLKSVRKHTKNLYASLSKQKKILN